MHKVFHEDGDEVKTGEIIWLGLNSFIFLRTDGKRIEMQTTDDRRMFVWIEPERMKLTIKEMK